MMALLKAPWKSTVSVKEPTKAESTGLASRPMASRKVRTRAEQTEIESRPWASKKVRTPAKASRKEPLKAGRIAMEPGKMMALMKAPWKWTVSVKKPTKLASRLMASQKVRTEAEPMKIESQPMASPKVWTMAERTEPESLPKASAKAQRMG